MQLYRKICQGISELCQGNVREMSGNFFVDFWYEPCQELMMNPNTNTNLRKNKMAANEKIKAILEISWGHNFTWPRIYN